MLNTGIAQKVVPVEALALEVDTTLSDPLLENENWHECTSWGKATLVALTNKVLQSSDPRRKELLILIDVFSIRHGYQIGIRLDSI